MKMCSWMTPPHRPGDQKPSLSSDGPSTSGNGRTTPWTSHRAVEWWDTEWTWTHACNTDQPSQTQMFSAHKCSLGCISVPDGTQGVVQTPMYVIEFCHPAVLLLASVLPLDALHGVIQEREKRKKTPNGKAVKKLLQFPDDVTPTQTAIAHYLKWNIGDVDLSSEYPSTFPPHLNWFQLMDGPIKTEFTETSTFERRPQDMWRRGWF